MTDTSQYGEGQFILDHFAGRDPVGLRFLDIGAFDGKTFSNTYPLAQAGWSGVCVEPSPPAFCHLMATYADNPRITLVSACVVGYAADLADFWVSRGGAKAGPTDADMVGTSDRTHMDTWSGHTNYARIVAPQVSMWEIFFWLDGVGVDFLNIDVEGRNLELLQTLLGPGLDTHWAPPEVICYEWDKQVDGDEPMRLICSAGYTSQEFGGNLVAWRTK